MYSWPRARGAALVLLAGLALLTASCGKKSPEAATETPSGPVKVTVNGKPIHDEDISQMVQVFQRENFNPPDSLAEGVTLEERQRNFALERLIERAVLMEEAGKLGLIPKPEELEPQVSAYKARFGFTDSLPPGMTEANIRQNLTDDLTVRAYIDKTILPGIQVTDQDMEDFYSKNPNLFERVHARHILIEAKSTATQDQRTEARRKIDDILNQVRKGADFAGLATQHSQDPYSGPNGGDLGSFGPGQMVPAFEKAAFALEPGQVSNVVESEFGFHIIKLEGKEKLKLDNIKPQMRDFLRDRKLSEALEARLKDLKTRARIDRNPS